MIYSKIEGICVRTVPASIAEYPALVESFQNFVKYKAAALAHRNSYFNNLESERSTYFNEKRLDNAIANMLAAKEEYNVLLKLTQ